MERLRRYIDLDEVARNGDISHSKLSNILCTATTFVTADGYVTYSLRSKRVSSQAQKYTSFVAENIQVKKDRPFQRPQPGELPVPFRTVIRGIQEELSPSLADFVRANPRRLMLLGMDFDLEGFQPDLLFMVAWPRSLAELKDAIVGNPGPDFVEIGEMQAVPLQRAAVERLLGEGGWVPGGKASFIRAVEFVEAWRSRYPVEAFPELLEIIVADGEQT